MLKPITAIAGGLIIALAIVLALDAASHGLLASSAHIPTDLQNHEAMRAYLESQPDSLLLALLVCWGVAAFTGSMAAAYLGGSGQWPGWAVGAVFLLTTAVNFAVVPQSVWMVTAAVVVTVIASAAGSSVGWRLAMPQPGTSI